VYETKLLNYILIESPTKFNIKKFWRFWDTWGVFVIFVVVAAIFGLMDSKVLQPAQLLSVVNRSSWIAIMAAGMAFAICTGGFDLAAGSMFSLCGALMAGFIMKSGMTPVVSILATFGVALVLSLINGLLISKLKITQALKLGED
jgi:ribose/xylose/arabinose/galactoside ABC-type transport system permease subunit